MPKAKSESGIPAGFERVTSGSFPANHDFKKNPVLMGTVTEIKLVPQRRGKKTEEVKVLYVADADGEIRAVWESHAIAEVCARVKVGDEVYFRFNGIVKLKGKKTMKDFEAAIKPNKKNKNG